MTTPKRPPRKAGNPDDSPWRSTPAAKRKRKMRGFTLSKEADEAITRLAEER